MTIQRMEQVILLAIAVVTGAVPFGLDPVFAGFMLAGLNVALALCAKSRSGGTPGGGHL
jgi:hypothetical protein